MSPERTCSNCGVLLPHDAADTALCPACAQAAGAPTRIARTPALETIGDYEVIDKLGQGGMGAVYRARQKSLGREVALKVLPHQFGDDPEFIGRFQREAKVAATLNHANLVRVYAAGQADGCHYIAMELIEGENLHQRMRRERLAIPEALRICADVARGLQYGWVRAQLVHRDIKPSNVYLSHGGEVKVGDLGLAKSLTGNSTGLTQSGTMMGTPHYMSPEQIRGDKALDFRADVYSLGCTLYELLTGQPPYPGSDPISIARAHLDAPLPAIIKAMPGCPMPLVRLLGRMLKKQPRERHASYEDLIAEMDWVREQIESGALATTARSGAAPTAVPAPIHRAPATPASSPSGKTGSHPGLLYGGIAAGVFAIAALAWWLTPSPQKRSTATPHPRLASEQAASTKSTSPGADWQPLMSESEWRAGGRKGREFVDGFLHLHPSTISLLQPTVDAAIRARIQIREDTDGGQVHLRSTPGQGSCALSLNGEYTGGELISSGPAGTPARGQRFTLPNPLTKGDTVELELRAVGKRLSARVNGRLVAEFEDHLAREPGRWGVGARNAWFEGIEVQALPSTQTSNGAMGASASEHWEDVLRKPARLVLNSGTELTDAGLRFRRPTSVLLPDTRGPRRDGAVRMRGTFGGMRTAIIARSNPQGLYQVLLTGGGAKINLERWDQVAKSAKLLQAYPLNPRVQPGQEYELELRAVGQELTVKFNGEVLGSVIDNALTEGGFGVGANDVDGESESPLIKSVEILDLDAPAGDGSWTELIAPLLAKGQLVSWWKQVGAGLQVNLAQGVILERKHYGDIAVRATARSEGNGAMWWIWLRESPAGRYGAKLERTGRGRLIFQRHGEGDRDLATFELPPGFSITENHTMEMSAQGDRITLSVDGREMATARDSTLVSGIFEIMGTPGTVFEKVEVR